MQKERATLPSFGICQPDNIMRAQIIHGLISDIPLPGDNGKITNAEISTLATRFVEIVNGRGVIENIARTELAPGREMPKGTLTLLHSSPDIGGEKWRLRQQFWLEGTIFIFYLGKPQDRNAACVCFVEGSDKSLVINQLQGLKGADFGPIRWEMVLVKITGLFARSAGFQRLMITPARLNNYWGHDPELDKRLFLHYDVTAKRLGFRRENVNGPYVFNFSDHHIRARQIIDTLAPSVFC